MENNIIANSASFISAETQELLQSQFFLMANWKWLALMGGFTALYFVNKFLRNFFFNIKKRLRIASGPSFISYFLKQSIERSLSWLLCALLGMILIENLDLHLNLEKYLILVLKLSIGVHVLRLSYLAADAYGFLIDHWAHEKQSQLSDQLAPLATKTLKAIVVILGSLILLQNFGVNVTALLAGLGIGGVALAFAAQDTVANFFGTVTILLDAPFRVGDRIKIIDIEGVVEEVGFRSTRIKTFYNSVVTIPNSVVAKEKIDNFRERDGLCRFHHVFGFTYNTSLEAIKSFSQHVQYFLKQDPRIQQDRIVVQFSQLAESSQNILIVFHFQIRPDESEFLLLDQYMHELVRIAQTLKMDFAFPTRTVILENPQATAYIK